MGRVEFTAGQPDEIADSSELNTLLAACETRTASYERDNFRERGLDHRACGTDMFAIQIAAIEETTRGSMGLTSAAYTLLNYGTAFETAVAANYAASDLWLVQYALFLSSVAGGALGIPNGAEIHAQLQWYSNESPSWTAIPTSNDAVGGPTGWTSELGNVEEVAHHSCLAGFAIFDGTAQTDLKFRVVVKDALWTAGTTTIYFEDCRMWITEFRQVQ